MSSDGSPTSESDSIPGRLLGSRPPKLYTDELIAEFQAMREAAEKIRARVSSQMKELRRRTSELEELRNRGVCLDR